MPVRELSARFQRTLAAAQAERPSRPELIASPGGTTEFAWQAHERHVMTVAVNDARAEYGLVPVPESDVAHVERLACGHADYPFKFALYCAELALGQHQRPTEAER